ncbi:lipopolysaccharide biosynthesis protein [Luteimonas sp. MC1750]|uniref:lipopolysaccharide biosynthesis protein n=1 Tax=Luteimonas sp. MC1750 TaxID=2799326 RepID=UPI0018F0E1D5|nr:lipopolysaccharide biosynthesis protein [Luteimonas sp. MC1750]MBJ6984225.1 lipopolysaccharide biosynthesis protein [Luteimonas sp. MC1750]QQO06988.1 lipopolysaccharide biosynthesis protein [Luteimonas sp. MC1750]
MTSVVARLRDRTQTLSKSRFIRNVAAVATGVAAAQAISLAFMPFLTRLYGPEAFGALAAFTAVVNIITPLATLGYANAIVMPETEEEATAVARLSLVCAALVAPLALLFVALFQSELAAWTGLEASPGFLYLIPVSLLLGALLSVANQTAIREGLFKAKAGSHVASTLVMNIGKLAGGLLVPVGLVLIVISMVGKALNYSMLLARVPRQGAFEVRRWFGAAGIRQAAREQRDFALYRMPQSVINAAAVGLPVILLSAFSGSAAAGQYSVTVLVLGAPVVLLGQSIGEVFYPKITAAIRRRSHDAWRLMLKATLVLSGLAVIAFGIIVVFGPELFAFALGEEWRVAGQYSRWVALWLACVLATRAVLAAFPALGLQSYLLAQELVSVATRSAALLVGLNYFGSDLVAVALFSLVGVFLMGALAAVGFWRLHRESRAWIHALQPAPPPRSPKNE